MRPLINPTLQHYQITMLTDLNDTDWENVKIYEKTDRQIGLFLVILMTFLYFFLLVSSVLCIWGTAKMLGITAEDLEKRQSEREKKQN